MQPGVLRSLPQTHTLPDRSRLELFRSQQQPDRASNPSIYSMTQKGCIDGGSDRKLKRKGCLIQLKVRSGEGIDRGVKQTVYSGELKLLVMQLQDRTAEGREWVRQGKVLAPRSL